MSITGLSGLSASGTNFDFSNLTRKQAIAAGGSLYEEGKISQNEMQVLQGFSVDSMPVTPGASDSPGFGLNSPVTRDYKSLIQQDLSDNLALGASQQKEVTNDRDLLSILAPYFRSSSPTSSTLQSTLDLQA